MMSKGNAPSAAQKRWREAVRGLGSIISGQPAVVHHCVGATGRHNKVDIGHWWILPLTNAEHLGLHAGDSFGYSSRKEFEKQEFEIMVLSLAGIGIVRPPFDVELAIEGYHR